MNNSTNEPNSDSLKMSPKVFLSSDDTNITKCTSCKNYLSVSPIIIHSNSIVCGRCVQGQKLPEDNRAYFYEILAKYMFFPCKNDTYGCSAKLPWGKVLDHEISCMCEGIICPAVECDNKIGSEEITYHFENKHPHLILKQDQCFLPQFNIENSYENKLFIWKNYRFIVQIMTSDNEDIYFRISSFHGPVSKPLKLILRSKSTYTVSLDKFVTYKYDSKFPDFSQIEKINTGDLKLVLGSEITCIVKFHDELKSENSNKLLSEVECPVCANYMRPPIYICPTGHSLCENCKENLSKCPLCFIQFGDTRNYSLEKIAEIITCPCRYKNQSCDITGKVCPICSQLLFCFKPLVHDVTCLVDICCRWRGPYSEMFQHISSHHGSFKLGCLVVIDDVKACKPILGYFEYDKNVFKLYTEWNKNKRDGMSWSVTCVKNEYVYSDKKYMFHLDFVSGNRILTISDICPRIPAAEVRRNCTHFVYIPFSQIIYLL